MNNNNENRGLEALDLLNIFSVLIQLMEIKSSGEETDYIHTVIQAIANEIEKLHVENDIIIKKLDVILEKLNGINN